MKYIPTRLDVKTDIQRSLMATYGNRKFEDSNFKQFLKHGLSIIKSLDINEDKKRLIDIKVKAAKNDKLPIEKRREDLLMIASLI